MSAPFSSGGLDNTSIDLSKADGSQTTEKKKDSFLLTIEMGFPTADLATKFLDLFTLELLIARDWNQFFAEANIR